MFFVAFQTYFTPFENMRRTCKTRHVQRSMSCIESHAGSMSSLLMSPLFRFSDAPWLFSISDWTDASAKETHGDYHELSGWRRRYKHGFFQESFRCAARWHKTIESLASWNSQIANQLGVNALLLHGHRWLISSWCLPSVQIASVHCDAVQIFKSTGTDITWFRLEQEKDNLSQTRISGTLARHNLPRWRPWKDESLLLVVSESPAVL